MIAIIDCGIGNLGSIYNMLKKAGAAAVVASGKEQVAEAKKIILPGVGSFDNGMEKLESSGLLAVIRQKVFEEKTPLLGICLGMQLMTKKSEEGVKPGLGWIDAETIKFDREKIPAPLRIPHMGWADVHPLKESRLFYRMPVNPRFYFVHAFHVTAARPEDRLLNAVYGYDFTAAFECDNIAGVQFHPEKSHTFGLKLLQNFAELF